MLYKLLALFWGVIFRGTERDSLAAETVLGAMRTATDQESGQSLLGCSARSQQMRQMVEMRAGAGEFLGALQAAGFT